MVLLGWRRRTRTHNARVEGGAGLAGTGRAEPDMDEIAALVRRAEVAGLDPRRVMAALGLDLRFLANGAGGRAAAPHGTKARATGHGRAAATRTQRPGSA